MPASRVFARYAIESRYPLAEAAAALAGEQSSGTFRAVPGETPALVQRFGARVEAIEDQGEVRSPSLPGSRPPKGKPDAKTRRGEIIVSWSADNMGPNLPGLWSTLCGNSFELHHFSALKLVDLTFPDAFKAAYPGPAHGIAGTRAATGVQDRPILGTIVKPSVGLSPQETASLVDTLVSAGLDFIKDDELQGHSPHSPFPERFRAVNAVIDRHAQRTGKRTMYAANITGDLDDMFRHLDLVQSEGGTCAMIVLNAVGLPAASAIRKRSDVPIHGHRAGWGLYDRSPAIGLSYVAYQKFWRLAGVDHLHVNGLANKFCETDESVIRSARACLTPLFAERADLVLPVFSSGQTVWQAPPTFAALGSPDLLHCAGGGIVSHPMGIEAGVTAFREAWEAALGGVRLETYAANRPKLRAALESFAP